MNPIGYRSGFLLSLAALFVAMGTISAAAQTYATYSPGRVMWVTQPAVKGAPAPVFSGPGRSYAPAGFLEVGEEVRVTAKSGNWFRLESRSGQGERFVYVGRLTGTRPTEARVTTTTMYATKRSNVRVGPGTAYDKVGLLEVGDEVRVTDKIGSWFKLEPKTGQQDQFVYGPLLTSTRSTIETITYNNGDRYHGQMQHGKRQGSGVYTWAYGDRYEGDFVDGKRTGRGIYTWANGNRYEGDFVDGKRTGRGTMVWKNGDRYEGSWKDNEPYEFATGADIGRAMQCIERTGGKSFRNRCDQPLAFSYCYKKASVGSTCGNPGIKEWVGKPEHYYNHFIPVRPGARFEVPYADREEISYAVCPQRRSGTFFHAVSSSPGKFKCRSLYPWIPRRKAERSAQLVERARREAVQTAAQRRAREQERLAAERATRERERAAGAQSQYWGAYVEDWTGTGYDPGNEVYGLAWNASSMEAAQRSAEQGCARRGGKDCSRRGSDTNIYVFSTSSTRNDRLGPGREFVVLRKRCIVIAKTPPDGPNPGVFEVAFGDTVSQATHRLHETESLRPEHIQVNKCNLSRHDISRPKETT